MIGVTWWRAVAVEDITNGSRRRRKRAAMAVWVLLATRGWLSWKLLLCYVLQVTCTVRIYKELFEINWCQIKNIN
jgi:hypothetical protein